MSREHLLQKMFLGIAVLTIPKCPIDPQEVENATGDTETKGLNHLGFLCLHWTMALRVTEAYYQ